MGGQLGGLDWHESCAEEEQSSDISCCLGSINMFWNRKKILCWDALIFLRVVYEVYNLFFQNQSKLKAIGASGFKSLIH